MEELANQAENSLGDGEVLPSGWSWTSLGEIADLFGGGTPSRAVPEYFTGEIVWLTPTEIPKSRIATLFDSKERITQEALRKSSARLLPAGTVLMTSRASIGYVAIAGTEVTTNQGFASFVVVNGIFNFYLAYWLWANAEFFENIATGTTFKEISKTKLRTIALPLAPLNEQRRIVAAIEAQFTRLDAGVAALKRLQANLKRYKAAVLKAACEGKLVPQDADDEPAADLLARILSERRAKWEADQREKGKDPRKLTYPEPAAPDTSDLPDLPEGWVWATTEQLSATEKYSMAIGPFGSNLMVNDYRPDGIPLVFVKEIRAGVFDRPGLPHISPEKAEELRAHHVHPGDLVITKMGEPPGDVAIFPDHIPLAVATSDCIKWTLAMYLTNHRYFFYAIRFPIVKKQILEITRGVAQQKMSLERFKNIVIPVPPLAEQGKIVIGIDGILSNIDELNQMIDANLHRSERLRQSILKEAFAGRLVAQDAEDEPASDLLQRIRQARAPQGAKARQRGQSSG